MALLSWFLDLVRRQTATPIPDAPHRPIATAPREMSPAGVEWLRCWEGYRGRLYEDGGGTIAIGFGHNVLPGEDWSDGITETQALSLLRRDLEAREAVVRECVTAPLNTFRFDSLVSFEFNTGALRRSGLLAKLNSCDYLAAAAEFDKWIWAGGQILPGLIRRRAAERALFERGEYVRP